MPELSGYSKQFGIYIQSMDRIQSQLQALIEMEKDWSDEMNPEQIKELLKRKQQFINNVQSLISSQQVMKKKLSAVQLEKLLPKELALKEKYQADIHQLLENVITLHNRHEEQVRNQSDKLKKSVEEVEQALMLIKSYQAKGQQQGSRIDLAG